MDASDAKKQPETVAEAAATDNAPKNTPPSSSSAARPYLRVFFFCSSLNGMSTLLF